MKNQRQWTTEEVQLLRDLYPIKSAMTIGAMINRSRTSVSSKANQLKIRKADDWATNPEAKRFFKGHMHTLNRKPHNKGKKQSDYLTEEQIKRIKQTQFKKGSKPSHTMPVGTIITRTNNLRKTYKFLKIDEKKWIFLHHKIWIEAHGEIPKGHVIAFKDKDTMNVTLENLYAISKEQHCNNNRDSKYPMELREIIRLKNKLKKEAWQRTKSNT